MACRGQSLLCPSQTSVVPIRRPQKWKAWLVWVKGTWTRNLETSARDHRRLLRLRSHAPYLVEILWTVPVLTSFGQHVFERGLVTVRSSDGQEMLLGLSPQAALHFSLGDVEREHVVVVMIGLDQAHNSCLGIRSTMLTCIEFRYTSASSYCPLRNSEHAMLWRPGIVSEKIKKITAHFNFCLHIGKAAASLNHFPFKLDNSQTNLDPLLDVFGAKLIIFQIKRSSFKMETF